MDELILNEEAIEATDTPKEDVNVPNGLGDEDIWGFDPETEIAASDEDSTESGADEANQQTSEAETPSDGEGEDEDTPDFLNVTYNHEDRTLSKKEAQTLAQKGMNYDKVKSQSEDKDAQIEYLRRYESFLNEIKGDFATVDDLIVDTKARMLMDSEKEKGNSITYDNAKTAVRERMPAVIDPKRLQADNAVRAFKHVYGDMKTESIPQEVWDDVKITGDLVGAYHNYEKRTYENRIAQLEKDLETERQKNKNASRKVGGGKSSGHSDYNKSMLDKIWNDA